MLRSESQAAVPEVAELAVGDAQALRPFGYRAGIRFEQAPGRKVEGIARPFIIPVVDHIDEHHTVEMLKKEPAVE